LEGDLNLVDAGHGRENRLIVAHHGDPFCPGIDVGQRKDWRRFGRSSEPHIEP
jgi:hypothetical protein